MTTAVGSTGSGAASPPVAQNPITNAPGGAMGKDQFIQLLVAQMSHQDPLNPMDGQQLASQLAQFSSVEQLMQINQSLTAQSSAQSAIVSALNSNSAIGAFGKTVTALGNQLVVESGKENSVSFSVGASGGAGTIQILDGEGQVVAEKGLGHVGAGDHTVDVSDATGSLPPGSYTFAVNVTDSEGNAVATQTYVSGRVDGISYGPNGATLTAGGLSIPFGSILKIFND